MALRSNSEEAKIGWISLLSQLSFALTLKSLRIDDSMNLFTNEYVFNEYTSVNCKLFQSHCQVNIWCLNPSVNVKPLLVIVN